MQLADTVLLTIEMSAIGIGAITDRFKQVTIVSHVNVLGETSIPTRVAELVDHACKPVELASIAQHIEVIFEGSVIGITISAVDTEAVLVFVRRDLATRRVAVASDIKRRAVAVKLSSCINLATFYIIRYGISVLAKALVPCKHGLVAIEREAQFAALKRLVGKPVAICALMSCSLVIKVSEVVAVCHCQCARLEANELAIPGKLVACKVGTIDGSQVDTICHRAASLVNPSAEGGSGSASDFACVEAILYLKCGISALSYAKDTACRTARCGNCCFVHTIFYDERRASINLCSTCNAADTRRTSH